MRGRGHGQVIERIACAASRKDMEDRAGMDIEDLPGTCTEDSGHNVLSESLGAERDQLREQAMQRLTRSLRGPGSRLRERLRIDCPQLQGPEELIRRARIDLNICLPGVPL